MSEQTIDQDRKKLFSGFWRRCAALIIDITIIILFLDGFTSILKSISDINLDEFSYSGYVEVMLASWLYSSLMESSKLRATLGKIIMGVIVIDLNGNRLGFGRATGRIFLKIAVFFILFFLQIIFFAVSHNKGSLVAPGLIMAAPPVLTINLALFIFGIFSKIKQTLYDKMLGIYVVRRKEYNISLYNKISNESSTSVGIANHGEASLVQNKIFDPSITDPTICLAPTIPVSTHSEENVSDESFWATALAEFDSSARRTGLWAKAYSESQGDADAAKAKYLYYRARELKMEYISHLKDNTVNAH